MVLAMAIGMVALHPLGTLAVQAAGAAQLLDHAEVMTLVMATDTAIAMGAQMAYRRHGWRDIAQMTAMYLPFVIFFPATLTSLMTRGAIRAGEDLLVGRVCGRAGRSGPAGGTGRVGCRRRGHPGGHCRGGPAAGRAAVLVAGGQRCARCPPGPGGAGTAAPASPPTRPRTARPTGPSRRARPWAAVLPARGPYPAPAARQQAGPA
jgi:hypothetical protein